MTTARSSPATLLRAARSRASLSQKGLAERAGTCQSVVARIEEGKVSPTWATMERLLAAADQELVARVEVAPVLDVLELDDMPRILAMSPENRLREVAAVDHMIENITQAHLTRSAGSRSPE